MRLIDLDKIDVFHQKDEDVVFDIIHATPVDAIPIEWLEDWFKYFEEHNKDYEGISQFAERFVSDWRKENETHK